jgi:hypothetical protein
MCRSITGIGDWCSHGVSTSFGWSSETTKRQREPRSLVHPQRFAGLFNLVGRDFHLRRDGLGSSLELVTRDVQLPQLERELILSSARGGLGGSGSLLRFNQALAGSLSGALGGVSRTLRDYRLPNRHEESGAAYQHEPSSQSDELSLKRDLSPFVRKVAFLVTFVTFLGFFLLVFYSLDPSRKKYGVALGWQIVIALVAVGIGQVCLYWVLSKLSQ